MSKKQPRGIRNNNPGNLRRSKDPWQGLAESQADPEFFTFKSAPWGIRALARTLITYQDKRLAHDGSRIDTIEEIVDRWAPAIENDTLAYVRGVDKLHPKTAIDLLDLHTYADLAPLVKAIIRHENGQQPYPDSVIDKGLSLAGIERDKPKSIQSSRTVKGSQMAAAGGTIAAVSGTLAALEPAIPVLREIGEFTRDYPYALLAGIGVAVIVGAGWAIWAKIDDRRRGIA